MKKNIFILVLSTILFVFNMETTQSQDYGSWAVPFQEANGGYLDQAWKLGFGPAGISETVVNDNLPGPELQFEFSAGGYAQNGDLLFYIVDRDVYQVGVATPIGQFTDADVDEIREEVQILRKPGSEWDYYIVYSAENVGSKDGHLFSDIIVDPVTEDISLGSNIDEWFPIYLPTGIGNDVAGAFAITKIENGTRYIFKMSSIGIDKAEINATGVAPNAIGILEKTNSGLSNYDFSTYNMEMIEKPNGDTYLAWSHKNPNGNMDKVFVYKIRNTDANMIDVDTQTTGEISGIEFSTYEDNVLYVSYNSDGTGSGIIKLDFTNMNNIGRTNIATECGHTFLQHAPDGNIYGVADDGLSLCKIDMTNGSFGTGAFTGQVLSYYSYTGSPNYYILPENEDQILYLELSSTGVSCGCDNEDDGSATVTGFGGVPPYTYEWTNSNGDVIGNGQTISNLGTGTYTCCITDSDLPTPFTYCEDVQITVDNSLLDFTYGNDMYEVDGPNNETWTNVDYSFRYGIRVHDGNTLTVDEGSYLEFYVGAKIIVEPGGELIIDNSTLTYYAECQCGGWLGIEVWGNPGSHQFVCNGTIDQGKVTIKDGSLIEHAEIAVLLGARVGSKGGGIVEVPNNGSMEEKSARFLNNRYALYFTPYQNHSYNADCSNNKPYGNLSYLYNTHFEVNSDYIYGNWAFSHAKLDHVDGIDFHGCTFVQNLDPDPKGKGIDALGSGFSVKEICNSIQKPCPENSLVYSSFTNFEKGISSANSDPYTAFIKNTGFYDNSTGIRLSSVDNATVLWNNFYLGKPVACNLGPAAFGMDVLGSTGFAIEENYFTKAQGMPKGAYVGIRIAETQATDEVYKNYFDGLSYGNYAVGKNWGDYTYNGLAFYCNENNGNWEDIRVTKNNQFPPTGGIQNPIGTADVPSGNTFSPNAKYHIYNDGDHWIGYFYYAPSPGFTGTLYYPEKVYQVTREEVFGIQNQCLSHYGGGGTGGGIGKGMVLTPEEKQQTEQDFVACLNAYNNVKALYDNLKDGGNTEAVLLDLETAWPNDMWELRAELLGKSPHLSMDVLKKAADKTDVLPESIIFEVMAANPDELKKGELIKYLEDKESPLPGYMIDILKQVSMGTTYKTVLQRQMAHHNQKRTRAAHDMIRSILNDTIIDYAGLRNWLDNIGGKRADEQIIATYMQEGNYSDAVNLANMMPALYAYEGNELAEHSYYTEMLNLQITLANEQRGIFDLDSIEVNNLVLIADNSNGTAGTQAKGILEFVYGYHYCNCIDADTLGYKSSGSFNPIAFEKMFGVEITVEPNPASEWAAFNYTLPDSETEGVIKISDVSGKLVTTLTISGKQGQKVWDTRKIKSGVYFYILNVSGFNKSGKIVISN